MVQTRYFSPLRHNSPTTAAGSAANAAVVSESTVATSPARSSTNSRPLVTSTEGRASALLECLAAYTLEAESSSSLDDRSDPASVHARETQRLVASLMSHLSSQVVPGQAVPRSATLTRRELEVLDAVADGMSTTEIAAVLHISVNTTRNHVQRILEKLDVHSRMQAVNEAVRRGLLQRRAG